MNSSANLVVSSGAGASPADLADSELLVATRLLVGRSNQLLAALFVHLAEVEARGVHRLRACSSLYAYCIYELRFSEDEAYRRVTAARLVRRFPPLRDAIATGELHLTGPLMLGQHLTEQNLAEVLARAKHRTKKEIARLVRWLDPLPDVPPRIEPLGPLDRHPFRRLLLGARSSSRWPGARAPARRSTAGLDDERARERERKCEPEREHRRSRGVWKERRRTRTERRGTHTGSSATRTAGTRASAAQPATLRGAVHRERGVRQARRRSKSSPFSLGPAPLAR